MTIDIPNEHFYVSSELAEVIDLVLERQHLLDTLLLSDSIDFQLASYVTVFQKDTEKNLSRFYQVTSRLETLIKKTED